MLRKPIFSMCSWAGLFLASSLCLFAAQPTPPIPAAIPQVPARPELLAWDAVMKEMIATNGQASAEFFFAVTNVSQSEVVIDHVTTSCGCTVAKLPSQPWILKPGEDGKINVSLNLVGKSGTLFKTVTVVSTNAAKSLTIKATIPENPEMARARNQQMAMADHQAVFKNDCARCHVEPTKGKVGKELYAAACGICHDAEHRATSVPDLRALNHSTDYNYWKAWATTGKPGTMMPGFSSKVGGPLTDEQIDSVAKYLSDTIAANPQPAQAKLVKPAAENSAIPPIPTRLNFHHRPGTSELLTREV